MNTSPCCFSWAWYTIPLHSFLEHNFTMATRQIAMDLCEILMINFFINRHPIAVYWTIILFHRSDRVFHQPITWNRKDLHCHSPVWLVKLIGWMGKWQTAIAHPPRWDMGTQIARFMGPTWGPPGADRIQVGPMLAPWILLSGEFVMSSKCDVYSIFTNAVSDVISCYTGSCYADTI